MDQDHRTTGWGVEALLCATAALLHGVGLIPYLLLDGPGGAVAAALAVCAAPPMLAVRRAPVLALAGYVVVALALPAALGLLVLTPAVGIPVHAVAAGTRGRVAAAWITGVTGLLLALGLVTNARLWQHNAWTSAVTVVLVVVVAGAAGVDQRRARRRRRALHREVMDADIRSALDAERSGIGAHLQRRLGSSLDALAAACHGLERSGATGTAPRVVRDAARAALADARSLLTVIRERPVPDGRPGPPDAPDTRHPVDAADLRYGIAFAAGTTVLDGLARQVLPGLAAFRLLQPVPQYAVVALAAAALVLRRRHPVGVLLAVAAVQVVAWWTVPLPATVTWVPYLLVLAIARWAAPLRSLPVAAAGTAVQASLVFAGTIPNPGERQASAATVVIVCVMAFAAGRWARSEESALRALRRRRHEQRLRAAVRRERLHLAREIHDDIAHHLAAVTVWANAAVDAGRRGSAPATGSCEHLIDTVRRARAALPDLGAGSDAGPGTVLDDATLDGLVAPLREAGALVTTSSGGPPPDPGNAAEGIACRIVREAVSNVLRHAGAAPTDVRVERGAGQVLVEVRNPLPASPPPGGPGFGLLGMRERAEIADGRCTAGPQDGEWVVTAMLPLPAATADVPVPPRAADEPPVPAART